QENARHSVLAVVGYGDCFRLPDNKTYSRPALQFALGMSDVGFRHIQADYRKPRPDLLDRVKKPPGTPAEIENRQFTLILPSTRSAQLGQRLPPDGIGCAVEEDFDLGVIPLSRIVCHPAA